MSKQQSLRKVLITGASGYLGGFVIERLRQVFDLTLFDRVAPCAAHADLPLVVGDITDADVVRRACRGHDAVVHLVSLVRERGGKPPALYMDVIVKGTWNVAQACVDEGVRRLVNVSSTVINWPKLDTSTLTLAKKDAPLAPIPVDAPVHFIAPDLCYKLSKVLAEQVCDAYYAAHGLAVVHLRPGAIAGDGVNPGPQSIEGAQWSAGRFFYVDPRDMAQATQAALTSKVNYGRYNIMAGRRDSLFEWRTAARDLGYAPIHNWVEIPEQEVGA